MINRRHFIKNTAITTASLPFLGNLSLANTNEGATEIPLNWLDQQAPTQTQGITWGLPWQRGLVKKGSDFVVKNGAIVLDSQTWPLAYWPDGSIKWTAHAIAAQKGLGNALSVSLGKNKSDNQGLIIEENSDSILINTGKFSCKINKKGSTLIESISQNGNLRASNGKLVLQVQNQASDENGSLQTQAFEGNIEKISLEQKGSVRSVVKIEGKHANGPRAWLPFTLRLYFYANATAIRMIHTIVFDGNEQQDFIRGLGIRFDVALNDTPAYNRHIRFVGENKGVFSEAVQGITGLRRDAGDTAITAQTMGKAIDINQFDPKFGTKLLQYVPQWGDYSLTQLSPDSFDIQKRTKAGYGWIQSAFGGRSNGTGYLGTAQGGIAFGIRNFWQSFPAQLDIRKAHTAQGEVTMWLWSPKAAAMDLRFYHDGMGQDTFEKQRDALDITYEDYEPEFGTAVGVARTSEVQLWVLEATPSQTELADIAEQIQHPPLLVATPSHFEKVGLFGGGFAVPNLKVAAQAKIEKQLDFFFDFYKGQVNERRWYGFWNYGDVMHTYDKDRHVWRYDVGGFAWDNSELATDLWLWYYFLRTGKSDVFRMAEAMTRHTGEVDVHHIGRFSPLGSRHNVQHWGCSAKQLRISTAANRRFYYYLTADERVGDLMREQVEAHRRLKDIIPGRKIGQKGPANDPKGDFASIAFGTDWGAIASAWLTEWERTENPAIKERLLNSMKTIGEQAHGFFTGGAIMELSTGKYLKEPASKISASHLSSAFGLPEICAELIDLVNMPVFEKAWLQYCVLYNASEEEQKAALGTSFDKLNLKQGHARLTAYAAKRLKDSNLAQRAWQEFEEGSGGIKKPSTQVHQIEAPTVLNPVTEGDKISTNSTAQWGLASMACLAFVGDSLK